MLFVDTNYFLRFFLRDVRKQYLQAKELFLQASSGEIKLLTSVIVFFEVYWVLKSYYGRNRQDLAKTLRKILELSFINLSERAVLSEAIVVFEQSNLGLEDCYHLCYAKVLGADSLATFDKKLSRKFKSLKIS